MQYLSPTGFFCLIQPSVGEMKFDYSESGLSDRTLVQSINIKPSTELTNCLLTQYTEKTSELVRSSLNTVATLPATISVYR